MLCSVTPIFCQFIHPHFTSKSYFSLLFSIFYSNLTKNLYVIIFNISGNYSTLLIYSIEQRELKTKLTIAFPVPICLHNTHRFCLSAMYYNGRKNQDLHTISYL